jgi:hypothetical protein
VLVAAVGNPLLVSGLDDAATAASAARPFFYAVLFLILFQIPKSNMSPVVGDASGGVGVDHRCLDRRSRCAV